MSPGEEIAITELDRTVAKLVISELEAPRPIAGRGRGTLVILSEDEEHLDDFQEHLP
jgi:antitoxin (DNA-binding transcriptional repressor) of toxin-antitoxin stability system